MTSTVTADAAQSMPSAEEHSGSSAEESTRAGGGVANPTPPSRVLGAGHYDAPATLNDLMAYCELLSKSTIVPQLYQGSPANVFAAALRAQALDIPWFLAIQETFVGEDGRSGMTALLTNYLLTRGGCEVTAVQSDATICIMHMTRPDRPGTVFEETWSIGEAAVAGLAGEDIWTRFPRDSLWARCMARMGRHYGADFTMGMSYTREEIAEMNRDKARAAAPGGGTVDLPAGLAELLDEVAKAATSAEHRVLWDKASKKKWLGLVASTDGRTVEQLIFDRGDFLAAQERDAAAKTAAKTGGTAQEVLLGCGCDPDEVINQGRHLDNCARKAAVG